MSDQTPAERVARYLSAREQVRGTDPEKIHALYTSFSEVARLEHSDLSALLAQREALLEALRPFADVSAKAKGSDDACWCGQDGAVIRYRDLRRAAELVALATSDDPPRPPA